jgi:hypothetical protein
MNADGDFVVEYTIKIDRAGNITNDVATNGNSFAEVYRAFCAIKEEVDRQIDQRRVCPFNPKYGTPPDWLTDQ